jgi:hypothetical protein
MQVLGIEKDLDLLGAADVMGRELQDARLTARGKPSVRAELSASVEPVKRRQTTAVADIAARGVQSMADKSRSRPRKGAGRWVEKSGFTSAQNLVDLIDSKGAAPKKRR